MCHKSYSQFLSVLREFTSDDIKNFIDALNSLPKEDMDRIRKVLSEITGGRGEIIPDDDKEALGLSLSRYGEKML